MFYRLCQTYKYSLYWTWAHPYFWKKGGKMLLLEYSRYVMRINNEENLRRVNRLKKRRTGLRNEELQISHGSILMRVNSNSIDTKKKLVEIIKSG